MTQSANGKQLKATLNFNVRGTSKLTTVADQLERINRQLNAINKINSNTIANGIKQANIATKNLNNSVDKTNRKMTKTVSIAEKLGKALKVTMATYLGVMGMRALVTTSDTITSTENKLNNLNGGNTALTQQQMDKMYAAAQSSRMDYADFMANVGKLATLSGDAFGGDMDAMIRFQELMAKNYALGGASAAEQASSMYQLIQAMGAGQLMGDELRSLNEGAPLAAKQIEELAQKIYNTTDSLKEMGSQGLITSDIVAQAILNSGEDIDAAFEKTQWTFKQAWINIKNTAIKTFEPVMQRLNYWLNEFIHAGGLERIGEVFQFVADVAMVVVNILGKAALWIADNWDIISSALIVIGIILASIVAYNVGTFLFSLYKTFSVWLLNLTLVQLKMFACIAVIALIVFALIYLFKTSETGTDFLINAMIMIIAGLMALSVITGAYWMLWVAGILLVATVIFMFLPQIAGAIIGAIMWTLQALENGTNFCKNCIEAIKSWFVALGTNIGVAINNGFYSAIAGAWNFVANVREAILKVANYINDILGIFGINIDTSGLEASIQAARDKAEAANSNKLDYVDMKAAWNEGMSTYEYGSLGDAWDSGYSTGSTWGTGVQDWVNNKFNSLKLPDITAGLPDVAMGSNLPGLGSLGSDLGDIADNTGDTAGNTGSMADTMQLAEEDLEYLRALANAEWKKEFTTANIVIDMNNTNTINNSGDLDGWVTQLTDKLYEELQSVADGVYV